MAKQTVSLFVPTNATERKLFTLLDENMLALAQREWHKANANAAKDLAKDARDVITDALSKAGVTDIAELVKEAKRGFSATWYKAVNYTPDSKAGKPVLPTEDRIAEMLIAIVVRHYNLTITGMKAYVASSELDASDARKAYTQNATKVLSRLLPKAGKSAIAKTPQAEVEAMGAKILKLKGFKTFKPASMTDPKFKKLCEWLFTGIIGDMEEEEGEEGDDIEVTTETTKAINKALKGAKA